jgi:hypothetical protein
LSYLSFLSLLLLDFAGLDVPEDSFAGLDVPEDSFAGLDVSKDCLATSKDSFSGLDVSGDSFSGLDVSDIPLALKISYSFLLLYCVLFFLAILATNASFPGSGDIVMCAATKDRVRYVEIIRCFFFFISQSLTF